MTADTTQSSLRATVERHLRRIKATAPWYPPKGTPVSVKSLAEVLEVSRQTLTQRLNGDNPTLRTLREVAGALTVLPWELVREMAHRDAGGTVAYEGQLETAAGLDQDLLAILQDAPDRVLTTNGEPVEVDPITAARVEKWGAAQARAQVELEEEREALGSFLGEPSQALPPWVVDYIEGALKVVAQELKPTWGPGAAEGYLLDRDAHNPHPQGSTDARGWDRGHFHGLKLRERGEDALRSSEAGAACEPGLYRQRIHGSCHDPAQVDENGIAPAKVVHPPQELQEPRPSYETLEAIIRTRTARVELLEEVLCDAGIDPDQEDVPPPSSSSPALVDSLGVPTRETVLRVMREAATDPSHVEAMVRVALLMELVLEARAEAQALRQFQYSARKGGDDRLEADQSLQLHVPLDQALHNDAWNLMDLDAIRAPMNMIQGAWEAAKGIRRLHPGLLPLDRDVERVLLDIFNDTAGALVHLARATGYLYDHRWGWMAPSNLLGLLDEAKATNPLAAELIYRVAGAPFTSRTLYLDPYDAAVHLRGAYPSAVKIGEDDSSTLWDPATETMIQLGGYTAELLLSLEVPEAVLALDPEPPPADSPRADTSRYIDPRSLLVPHLSAADLAYLQHLPPMEERHRFRYFGNAPVNPDTLRPQGVDVEIQRGFDTLPALMGYLWTRSWVDFDPLIRPEPTVEVIEHRGRYHRAQVHGLQVKDLWGLGSISYRPDEDRRVDRLVDHAERLGGVLGELGIVPEPSPSVELTRARRARDFLQTPRTPDAARGVVDALMSYSWMGDNHPREAAVARVVDAVVQPCPLVELREATELLVPDAWLVSWWAHVEDHGELPRVEWFQEANDATQEGEHWYNAMMRVVDRETGLCGLPELWVEVHPSTGFQPPPGIHGPEIPLEHEQGDTNAQVSGFQCGWTLKTREELPRLEREDLRAEQQTGFARGRRARWNHDRHGQRLKFCLYGDVREFDVPRRKVDPDTPPEADVKTDPDAAAGDGVTVDPDAVPELTEISELEGHIGIDWGEEEAPVISFMDATELRHVREDRERLEADPTNQLTAEGLEAMSPKRAEVWGAAGGALTILDEVLARWSPRFHKIVREAFLVGMGAQESATTAKARGHRRAYRWGWWEGFRARVLGELKYIGPPPSLHYEPHGVQVMELAGAAIAVLDGAKARHLVPADLTKALAWVGAYLEAILEAADIDSDTGRLVAQALDSWPAAVRELIVAGGDGRLTSAHGVLLELKDALEAVQVFIKVGTDNLSLGALAGSVRQLGDNVAELCRSRTNPDDLGGGWGVRLYLGGSILHEAGRRLPMTSDPTESAQALLLARFAVTRAWRSIMVGLELAPHGDRMVEALTPKPDLSSYFPTGLLTLMGHLLDHTRAGALALGCTGELRDLLVEAGGSVKVLAALVNGEAKARADLDPTDGVAIDAHWKAVDGRLEEIQDGGDLLRYKVQEILKLRRREVEPTPGLELQVLPGGLELIRSAAQDQEAGLDHGDLTDEDLDRQREIKVVVAGLYTRAYRTLREARANAPGFVRRMRKGDPHEDVEVFGVEGALLLPLLGP